MWKMGLSGAFKKRVGRHFSPWYQQFLECFLELLGVSFKKFGIVSNMGLLFNQQHAAVAQVQLQEQDACRYVTCPGTQPVGTKLLPEDIIAPPSDLYPHRLWGKPEEDLTHRPKYLLTLTVDLKQKDFVNQCVQGGILRGFCTKILWSPMSTFSFGIRTWMWRILMLRNMQSFKNHGLEISQPGLEPGQGLTWEMTKL